MYFKLIWSQARQKWIMSLLLLMTMTALVSLYVFIQNSTRFTNRAMQLIMKRMGHNLVILPAEADPLAVHLCADDQRTFPDTVTHELARHTQLLSKYYVSVLQKRSDIGDVPALLTGIEPVRRPDESAEKGNMIRPVIPGTVRLGAVLAEKLRKKAGDTLTVHDEGFVVKRVMAPRGSQDDHRVYLNLGDAQRLLGMPGLISGILAFECLHMGSLEVSERFQRRELAKVMPGYRQITRMDIAQGRYMARMTTSRYLHYLLAIVLIVTVLVIVIAGLQEVAERTGEVGIMVSMGASYRYIAGLYLGKIAVLAACAGFVGFLFGSHLAVWLTSSFLVFKTQPVIVLWDNLPRVMALTCALALTAALVPTARLVTLDPGAILSEE